MRLDGSRQTIKQVGLNGQVCLGKEYAGKQIQISKMNDGSLLIQAGQFVPDTERWLHSKAMDRKITQALAWAESHPRRNNFEEVAAKIEGHRAK